MSATKPNPSPAMKRRQVLRGIQETGSTDGIHKTMLARFKAKGYLERSKAGAWSLTKMGKAVMEGRIGKAGRGAVDMGSARFEAERGFDGRRRTAKGSSMAPYLRGDGTTTRRRIEREARAHFEKHGDQLKAEWEAEQATYRKAVARILGPKGAANAVKIARADGLTFHREELQGLQDAGWEVHPGGTVAAQVGKALKGVRPFEFNPVDPLERALGPEGETRAVVLVAAGITEETLHRLRGAGYDLSPAPKRIREGSIVKPNPQTHFKPAQLKALRDEWAKVATVPPTADFRSKWAGLSTEALEELANARIKFVSALARNEVSRRTLALNPTGQERPRAATGSEKAKQIGNMTKPKAPRKAPAKTRKPAPGPAAQPTAAAPGKVQPLKSKAALRHRAATELAALLEGAARHRAKPSAKAKARAPKPTLEKFTLSGRFNPTSAGDLAQVWRAWTGADPDQTLSFDVERPSVSLSTGGRVTIPEKVVVLGRVAKLITKAGRLADFGEKGPLMVTDAKAERVWLLSDKPYHFDLEPSVIAYLARKPKFGDRGTVEYVHGFKGRVRVVMAGQVGAMTGGFRITPRGLED